MSTDTDDASRAIHGPAKEDSAKKSLFKRLAAGLSKTGSKIAAGIDGIFKGFSRIDEDFYDGLEETLILGDLGVAATEEILERLRKEVRENHIKDTAGCKDLLIDIMKEQMRSACAPSKSGDDIKSGQSCGTDADTPAESDKSRPEGTCTVILIVGANGVGKTTTVGKLAAKFKSEGKKVQLAAADTFRAAADEQLSLWAKRVGVDIIRGGRGADPASVVYDSVSAAKARGADVLIIDTAGRLHNKKNLMEELGKINRVITRVYPEAQRETFIVLDATTGQNAMAQVKEFSEAAFATGIILTKMDGTAKGGIVFAIASELAVPVRYIGVGEDTDDLQEFDPDMFIEALFASGKEQDVYA